MIFETNRLIVRKLNNSDFLDFHKMQSDIDVMRYITGKVASYNESKIKLKTWIERYQTNEMHWPYAIELKSTNDFIGICGLINNNEVGYRFLPDFWNNGFGTEILNGLIKFSKKIGIKILMAQVAIKNEASYKMLTNAGFVKKEETICKKTNIPEFIMELSL